RRRPGAVVSGLAQIGYLLAVLSSAAVFLLCPALVLVLFLMSLLPETLPERQARRSVGGRPRARGPPAPAASPAPTATGAAARQRAAATAGPAARAATGGDSGGIGGDRPAF